MTRRAREGEPVIASLSWAAAELGIGIDTARKLAKAGELPGAFPIGTLWRVSTAEFHRQITARAAATDRPLAVPGAPQDPAELGGGASVAGGRSRRSEGLRGARIAADAPRVTITADEPSLVRRPRRRAAG